MPPAELVRRHEESEEAGGYFIVNGNEKIIRFLILPRRNHVISLVRPSFMNRGAFYTQYACQIRSVRLDQSSLTNTVHYLSNGNVTFRFSWRKNEYMIPIVMVLKALMDVSDKDIFCNLAQNNFRDTFRTDRIELLLRGFKTYALPTGKQCLEFLGDKFRIVLGCPEDWDNKRVGIFLLERVVLVHLDRRQDKFNLLMCVLDRFRDPSAGLLTRPTASQLHDPEALRLGCGRVLRGQSRLATASGSLDAWSPFGCHPEGAT